MDDGWLCARRSGIGQVTQLCYQEQEPPPGKHLRLTTPHSIVGRADSALTWR